MSVSRPRDAEGGKALTVHWRAMGEAGASKTNDRLWPIRACCNRAVIGTAFLETSIPQGEPTDLCGSLPLLADFCPSRRTENRPEADSRRGSN
jgi:hypothetical protein